MDKMNLAICGGKKVRSKPFCHWPNLSMDDFKEVAEFLNGSDLFRGTNFPSTWFDSQIKDNKQKSELEKLESQFADLHSCKYGFFINSGTTALDLALNSLNLQPGDEVLVTPYTYFASASSIKKNNGTPVFVDIDPKTLNMDVLKAKESITSYTRAIVIVHFGGIPADMEEYMQLIKQYDLKLVEDCCHTVFAKSGEKPVGSFGDVSCFSFQSSKLLSSGEGGAIVTNNLKLANYMFSLHNGGRVHMEYGKENFIYLGNNYRYPMSCFAFLKTSMKKVQVQSIRRRENAIYFKEKIKEVGGLEFIGDNLENQTRDYYIVALRYHKEEFQNLSLKRLVMALNAEGIPCSTGYKKVLYEFPVLLNDEKEVTSYKEKCHETELAKKEILWFPHYIFLEQKEDVDDMIYALKKVKENANELIRKR